MQYDYKNTKDLLMNKSLAFCAIHFLLYQQMLSSLDDLGKGESRGETKKKSETSETAMNFPSPQVSFFFSPREEKSSSKNSGVEKVQPLDVNSLSVGTLPTPEIGADVADATPSSSTTPSDTSTAQPYTRSQEIYFKHIEKGGIGYDSGYSTLGGFFTAPCFFNSNVVGFLDLRGHYLNNGRYAANAGLGIRYITDRANIVGGGIFYDYRLVRSNPFHQVGAGLELLGSRWEARLNGYLPVGIKKRLTSKHKHVSFDFGGFVGNALLVNETTLRTKKYHYALGGGDAEIGAYLFKPTDNFALFLGAGPYALAGPVKKTAVGGQARLEARITPYLTVQVIESWDTVFRNNVQGEVSLNIPFGGKCLKKHTNYKAPCSTALPSLARIRLPMHRREIIPINDYRKHSHEETFCIAINPATGMPWHFVFVDNSQSCGQGTFECPFPTIDDAGAKSGPNDVIYVRVGNGTTSGLDWGIVLQDQQQLLGAGIPHVFATECDGCPPTTVTTTGIPIVTVTVPPLDTGFPHLTTISPSSVVELANNNVVSGLHLDSLVFGIEGFHVTDVVIANNIIDLHTSGFVGIDLEDFSGNAIIVNNQLQGSNT